MPLNHFQSADYPPLKKEGQGVDYPPLKKGGRGDLSLA